MTEKILVLFALAGAGYLLRRRNFLGAQGLQEIIRLDIDFLFPALTFITTAVNLNRENIGQAGSYLALFVGLPILACVICLAGVLLGWACLRFTGLKSQSRMTFIFLIGFANASFLPLPLCYALKGDIGVLHVFFYLFGYTILQWTLGLWLLKGKAEYKLLLHPQMLALVLGTVVGVSQVTIPNFLAEPLKLLGNSGVPLALLCVGGVIAEQRLAIHQQWRAQGIALVLKLAILPGLVLLACRWGGINEPLLSQAIIQAAMPCMASAALFTTRFGGDSSLASGAAFLTTILSVITVPFFMGFIQ